MTEQSVKISRGNSKMGAVPSVSLPAGITCRSDCECYQKCYARKISRLRRSVRDAYYSNYSLLKEDSDAYWRGVEGQIMMSRFFRFHVSGDIPDADYFCKMVEVSRRNPHCKIVCFTKKYDIVNSFLENKGTIPDNLCVIFSVWKNLEVVNPFSLPEAHVRYKDGSTTARWSAQICGGNCAECGITNSGCWTLKKGEQVVFDEH